MLSTSPIQLNVVPAPTLHQPLHSKVTNYLNAQRRQRQFCDLILQLENGDSIFGHFCVVAAQSRFIGGSHFLQKNLQFSIHNPLKVIIKNFHCSECLQTIADFFYEDIVTVVKEHESHFKQLAKILWVSELLKLFQIPEEGQEQIVEMTNEYEALENFDDFDYCETRKFNDLITDNNDMKLLIHKSTENNVFNRKKTFFKLKSPRSSISNCKINYCLACDFKCYRIHEMIEHMRNCEASHLTCSLCEIGFLNWREYDSHLKCHELDLKKPFFCLECDARFMTRTSLTLHYPKHSKETPFVCSHCGKGFKWKQGLNTHLLVHNNEKRMLCDICGYSTTHMKALKSHKVRHTSNYFKCTIPGCHHKANRKENLKLHIETHKQERPFVCEVCGCKFSLSKNLKRHSIKHSTNDKQKHKCLLCSFASYRSDKLKEHIQRIHTEKVVQLELPEIVENAFEFKSDLDEFSLPNLPNLKESAEQKNDCNDNKANKGSKRKSRKTNLRQATTQRQLRPVAPKLT